MCLLANIWLVELDGCSWFLFLCCAETQLRWERNDLSSPPNLENAHPIWSAAALQIQQIPKLFWMFIHSFSLVFWWLRGSFPPRPTVFLRSTQSLIENIFPLPSAPGRQRSGTARGQPPWSYDGFWILLKGTLSLPDAHWHDSLNKVERYFQVWKGTPVENDAFCLSKFRLWLDYFLSLYHVYHPGLRVKVQPLIKLLRY